MSKFTNVDYNKNLIYNDGNPFQDAFKEKYEESKTIVETAYKKKVEHAVSEGMYDVRNDLKGPGYEELILNKGTDAEMLNPKFYDLMNVDPESIMKSVRDKARKRGVNPQSIRPEDVMTDELNLMRKDAVRQHYDELARYADENGNAKLQKLLDKEGPKFSTFYRKFSDPYINEARGALWINTGPGAEQGATQRALARKHPHLAASIADGVTFKEDANGNLYQTSGFLQNLNQLGTKINPGAFQGSTGSGSQVMKDADGRSYIETGNNPFGALMSNIFGSGNMDMNRQYLADEENPDEWFWWGQ